MQVRNPVDSYRAVTALNNNLFRDVYSIFGVGILASGCVLYGLSGEKSSSSKPGQNVNIERSDENSRDVYPDELSARRKYHSSAIRKD